MTRFALTYFVTLAFVVSSCIHTKSKELVYLDIDASETRGLTPLLKPMDDRLAISYLVYTPSKLPLEDFFRRLANGEFGSALDGLNLGYTSNTRNEILRELLDAGLVPVYVRIKNESDSPKTIAEKDFFLSSGPERVSAIAAVNVPREFERFHPEAVAANVINVTTAIVIIVAVVVVLAAACQANCGGLGNAGGPSWGGDGGDGSILNDTTLTRQFGYRDYLIQATMLEPGASVEGLVFFRTDPKKAYKHELIFDPAMYLPRTGPLKSAFLKYQVSRASHSHRIEEILRDPTETLISDKIGF